MFKNHSSFNEVIMNIIFIQLLRVMLAHLSLDFVMCALVLPGTRRDRTHQIKLQKL